MQLFWNQEIGVKIICLKAEDVCSYFGTEALFDADAEAVFTVLSEEGKGKLYLGLGKEADLKAYRLAGFHGVKTMTRLRLGQGSIDFKGQDPALMAAFMEGALEGQMERWNLKTKEDERPELRLGIQCDLDEGAFKLLEEGIQNLTSGIQTTRDLVNRPASHLTPDSFCQATRSLLVPLGVEVSVYGEDALEDIGMKAFLSVAKGSKEAPKMLVMDYRPVKGQKPVSLVGKGLTYDSGGFHLKPLKWMRTMHSDMAGAATVVGLIEALAKNGIQRNVVGVCCLCENILSRDAYKNGDVVGSMKGLTIEISDTDAEGRLTLADALYYTATNHDPELIIDMATLTGSCVVGLGPYISGVMTNNQEAYQRLYEASQKAGEYVWQLPLYPEVYKALESRVADLKNDIDGPPGAILAGAFLERFVENKPWIHMDIAGPAYLDAAWGILPKDATGVPLKTLYHFLKP